MIDTTSAIEELQRIIKDSGVPETQMKAIELLAGLNQQEIWRAQAEEHDAMLRQQGGCADCPPKVGDIVLYNHPGDKTGTYPPKQSPAMVLQVHEDGSADIRVFTAPTWGPNGALGGGGEYINFRAVEGTEPFNWTRR